MLLTDAQVCSFRSIDDSGPVPIDAKITVLVGQNESGKTAFLQALNKALSVEDEEKYEVIQDYPRKNLNAYEKKHASEPDKVCTLTYACEAHDVKRINDDFGFKYVNELTFSCSHKYDNKINIGITIDEGAFLKHLASAGTLSTDVVSAVSSTKTLREFAAALELLQLNDAEKQFLEQLKTKFSLSKAGWAHATEQYIWNNHLSSYRPRFLYFDDYRLLPGKVNLTALQQAVATAKGTKQPMREEDRTVMGLLRMAGVDLNELVQATTYENIKAKLEGISNSITDKVFQYWKQNSELDVEFDIRADPQDRPPFNSGNNLYIRIRNRRHRVTVPFSQRSKGFIWFFSFIVWFDSIQEQMQTDDQLVLLLDEPGLSLHALAQADFLDYIDELANEQQVVYTTHSPFMVRNDRLVQVRAVQDRGREGTKVTSNISASDPNTVFPLQAALGYSIAQNLFISKRNLVVEGPSDLIYLRWFSAELEKSGKTGMREDVVIVPVGGLDKLSTFVALLGANRLELVVLHDYSSSPDPHLTSLVREKIIREKNILNYAIFRTAPKRSKNTKSPASLPSTDVEDLLEVSEYLKLFNAAYKVKLSNEIVEADLPPGDRIVVRIAEYLSAKGIKLRPSGGFNHYLPAQSAASSPITLSPATLARVGALFDQVNDSFTNEKG
jgi:predicted ATPase